MALAPEHASVHELEKEVWIQRLQRYYQVPTLPQNIKQLAPSTLAEMANCLRTLYPVEVMDGIALPKECSRVKVLGSVWCILETQKPHYHADFFAVAEHLAVHVLQKLPVDHAIQRSDIEKNMASYTYLTSLRGLHISYVGIMCQRHVPPDERTPQWLPPLPGAWTAPKDDDDDDRGWSPGLDKGYRAAVPHVRNVIEKWKLFHGVNDTAWTDPVNVEQKTMLEKFTKNVAGQGNSTREEHLDNTENTLAQEDKDAVT